MLLLFSRLNVACLFLFCWGVSPIEAQDTKSKYPHIETQEEYDARHRDYRKSSILDSYVEHSRDTGKAKKSGVAFLKMYLELLNGGPSSQVNKMAQAITVSGNTDPHLLTFCVRRLLETKSSKSKQVVAAFDQAAEQLPNSDYPPYTGFILRHWQTSLKKLARKKRKEIVREAANKVVQFIENPPEHDPQFVWTSVKHTFDNLTVSEAELVLKAIRNSENAQPWLKAASIGRGEYRIAWKIRGDGFASSVAEEAWKEFYERLELADDAWSQAHALRPDVPVAATALIHLSLEQRNPAHSPEHWFKLATDARSDYLDAYNARARSLSPIWGGNVHDLLNFGCDCAESERYDTGIPDELSGAISTCYQNGRDVLDDEGLYQLAVETCEKRIEYLEGIGDNDSEIVRQKSFIAAFAHLAKDFRKLAEVSADLDGNYDSYVFRKIRLDPKKVYEANLNRNRPAGKAIDRILALTETVDVDIADLESAISEVTQQRSQATEQELSYQNALIAHANSVLQFQNGEWAEIQADPHQIALKSTSSRWSFSENSSEGRSITLTTEPRTGQDVLSWRHPIEAPFVMEVVVEPKTESTAKHDPLVGLFAGFVGSTTGYKPKSGSYIFFMRASTRRTGYFDVVRNYSAWRTKTKVKNKLRVYAWKSYALLDCNNQKFIELSKDGFSPSGWVGICSVPMEEPVSVTKFSNLRIKKLDFPSPAKLSPAKSNKEYWKQWAELGVGNNWSKLGIASGKYYDGDLKGAIEDHEAVFSEAPDLNTKPLACCYELNKDYAKAKEAYLRSLELNAGDTDVIFWLARLLVLSPDASVRSSEMAVSFAEKLRLTGPNEPVPHQILAAAWANAGDFKKAIQFQTKAIRANPNATSLKDTLALYQKKEAWRLPADKSLQELLTGPWSDVAVATSAQLKVTDGLVARFPLDFKTEESFGSRTSASRAGVKGAPGKVGSGVTIGKGAFILAPKVADFGIDDPFSYGGWINSSTISSPICGRTDTKTYSGHSLGLLRERLMFRIFSNDEGRETIAVQSKEKFSIATWHHVMVTYDGTGDVKGINIFVDGKRQELRVKDDGSPSNIRTSKPFGLGKGLKSVSSSAKLDEFRVYDRELSEEEIQQIVSFGTED